MNKVFFWTLLWVTSIAGLSAQVPDWVSLYLRGSIGEIAGNDYYLGIGVSAQSQEDADQKARVEFARNVETRVESRVQEAYRLNSDDEESSVDMTLDVRTELSLKGIAVSQRYPNESDGMYYSMILISRQEYLGILEKNIREELAEREGELQRQRVALEEENLARQRELDQQRAEQEQKRLEHEQEMEDLRMKQERVEARQSQYADYLARQAYPHLISFENGEIYPGRQLLSSSFSLSDEFSLRNIRYAYCLGEAFQLGSLLIFNPSLDKPLRYGDAEIKVALLNNKGRVVRFSVAMGARGYFVSQSADEEQEPDWTLFGAVNVNLPQLYYTDFSAYAGLDQIAVGATNYALFPWIGDSVGLIFEGVYDFRKNLQYGASSGSFKVQTGLQFHPDKLVCSRITWEDNFKTWTLAVDLNLRHK